MRNRTRIVAAIMCLCIAVSICNFGAKADNTEAKLLAITFDDGPSAYTATLLTALKQRGVKATFFIVGNRANSYIHTIERMYDDGHQICNHSYSHTYFTRTTADVIQSEINQTNTILSAVGAGIDHPIYVRCPGGLINDTVRNVVQSPLIQWSVDPEDWKDRNASTVRSRIVSKATDGAIILVLDLYKTSVDGAIMAIDDLLAKGYEFVTVDELLLRRGVAAENGVKYSNAKNTGTNLPKAEDPTEYTGSIESHWAYNSIKRVLNRGIYVLQEGATFAPEKRITRGMFITMLGRLDGVDSTKRVATGYTDVLESFYQSPYVAWAEKNGIMTSSTSVFRVGETMTKEEMISVLTRYLKYKGISINLDKAPNYADESYISDWAKKSIDYCKYTGIINKSEYSNCSAQKEVTKAEACEYICRVMDFLESPAEYINSNSYPVLKARAALLVESIRFRSSFWQRIRNWF